MQKFLHYGKYLLPSILVCFVFLLSSNSDTEERKSMEEFQQYYRVYSLSSPKHITFAGTKISLAEFDVAERYDKEILTNVYWQSQTLLMLKRANRYLPIIEKILLENGIPSDFKYLALAESGLQNVVSPAGAAGFWQFLDKTGKRYGLEINEEVDERYHLEKATKAACLYLNESYQTLQDWSLVAASYNMGLEGVKKQLRNQQVSSYYDLYLNVETARYLFRIIAIKDICENPSKFGFNISATDYYKPIPVVWVKVNYPINGLAEWSKTHACNYKILKLLNPWLRKPFLNPTSKTYYISLPKDKLLAAGLGRQIIADTLRQDESNATPSFSYEDHTVVKGETLKSIAEKYGISEEDICTWNEILPGTILKPGSKIRIRLEP